MLSGKAIDYSSESAANHRTTKTSNADRKITKNTAPAILQRIAARDKSAVEECINKHGALIWALAKHFTDTPEEAEAATLEIFRDLWECAARFDSVDCEETDFVVLVARRRFIKRNLQRSFDSAYPPK